MLREEPAILGLRDQRNLSHLRSLLSLTKSDYEAFIDSLSSEENFMTVVRNKLRLSVLDLIQHFSIDPTEAYPAGQFGVPLHDVQFLALLVHVYDARHRFPSSVGLKEDPHPNTVIMDLRNIAVERMDAYVKFGLPWEKEKNSNAKRILLFYVKTLYVMEQYGLLPEGFAQVQLEMRWPNDVPRKISKLMRTIFPLPSLVTTPKDTSEVQLFTPGMLDEWSKETWTLADFKVWVERHLNEATQRIEGCGAAGQFL